MPSSDAAFGALGRTYGSDARGAITGITLIAGFASTVGWPLSSLGLETIGWRETCYAWAAAHIVIALPLNLLLPRTERIIQSQGPTMKPHIAIDRTTVTDDDKLAARERDAFRGRRSPFGGGNPGSVRGRPVAGPGIVLSPGYAVPGDPDNERLYQLHDNRAAATDHWRPSELASMKTWA